MPPSASSKSQSHSENGVGFIWHSQVRKWGFFTTDLRLPNPEKGQRSYHRANDEMVFSTFPYLPLSYRVQDKNQSAKALAQSVSTSLTYSRGWFHEVASYWCFVQLLSWHPRDGNGCAFIAEQGKCD